MAHIAFPNTTPAKTDISMKNFKLLIPALIAGLFVSSCNTLNYGDAEAEETVTIGYGSTDKQAFAGAMVDSLIVSPALNYVTGPGKRDDLRIIVYMGGVQNRTSEHIDTTGITDSIRKIMLSSGKFRFVTTASGQSEIGDQVNFQQESGRVDPAMARDFGKQLGADVVMYGTLRSIEKTRDRTIANVGTKTDDLYYQFVLECANIETGEVIWLDEKELRKTEKTSLFGG